VDPREAHRRAVEQAAAHIDRISPDQLSLPTPCPDWDVRVVINHLVVGNRRIAALARGETPPPLATEPPDLIGDNATAVYRTSAVELVEAFDAPGALDRPYPIRIGEVTGPVAVALRLVDTVAHTWDLTRATGQDETLDPELVGAADELARAIMMPALRGPGRAFAEEVAVAADAPAEHRLVAFLGRHP
jgi:uncharacterized protein (TIGR03086 family)